MVRPVSRKITKEFVSKTGVTLKKCYCRKCMTMKDPDMFYDCVDNGFIDANGKMSICKECCNTIFDNIYSTTSALEKATLKTCRYLNIAYNEDALKLAVDYIETLRKDGKNVDKFFGIYKAKVHVVQNKSDFKDKGTSNEDLTFVEPILTASKPTDDTHVPEMYELKMTWGENLEYDDYVWLEKELSEWKKTHKCDTKAEKTLLEQICLTGFAIRKARSEGRAPGNLIKEYQELMRTANVDPAKTAIAGGGKSQDTFSAFIKTIEENEPAEYFADKKLFKDFDNLDFYFRKYITRPLQNFITQSRNFDVSSDSDENTEDFDATELLSGE